MNEIFMSSNGKLGEEKFIISAKWWQTWWDYVNFESLFEEGSKSWRSSITKTARFSLEKLSNLEEKSNRFEKICNDNDSTIYNRPGKISNNFLIDPESFNKYKYSLKESLQEFYDYVVVSSNTWDYLSSWYNYDFAISKELAQNISDSNSCVLNIYPDDNEVSVDIKRNPDCYIKSDC